MLAIALAIGLYSYAILLLGLVGKLNQPYILVVSLILMLVLFFKLRISNPRLILDQSVRYFRRNYMMLTFIVIFGMVNLIGALGPELGFDALWYHLTLPKIYLANQKIFFIHGGLFYYSLLPKLTEMLYIASLALGNEVIAKLIHFSFGLLTCIATYKLARNYIPKKWALFAAAIFYSNLVVDWLSITAYVDLARSFYETAALLFFIYFLKNNTKKNLILSSILLGLAICVKVLSLGSILTMSFLILFFAKGKLLKRVVWVFTYASVSLFVTLPWFLVSYYFSKNPFYPFFSNFAPHNLLLTNLYPVTALKNILAVFLFAADPIQPIYLICLPLIVKVWVTVKKKLLPIVTFILFSIIYWYLTSFLGIWHGTDQAGSARFLTAYLPACSVVVCVAIYTLKKGLLKNFAIGIAVTLLIVSFFYRLIANARYVPVILGFESKKEFLMENLNFSYGDFFDENEAIKRIVGDKTVELINMHNLYYIDFPFTLDEFMENKKPSFVLVQNGTNYKFKKKTQAVYQNEKTHVTLYKLQ